MTEKKQDEDGRIYCSCSVLPCTGGIIVVSENYYRFPERFVQSRGNTMNKYNTSVAKVNFYLLAKLNSEFIFKALSELHTSCTCIQPTKNN